MRTGRRRLAVVTAALLAAAGLGTAGAGTAAAADAGPVAVTVDTHAGLASWRR